ncbi:MAG TPA: hypothetical protein EYP25_02525 [Anaerolineae bacterium]|nr:hypothetical protein [Caldilineae bacterium]HID33438.1 hypothetical protein [Anaerolineae bacterium]
MMHGKKRHRHSHEHLIAAPGPGRQAPFRGMRGHRHGPMAGRGGRMGRGPCWEEDDDARRAWLEARKRRLQERLAEVEAELAALDPTGVP